MVALRLCITMPESLHKEAVRYSTDHPAIGGVSPLIAQALDHYLKHLDFINQVSQQEYTSAIRRRVRSGK